MENKMSAYEKHNILRIEQNGETFTHEIYFSAIKEAVEYARYLLQAYKQYTEISIWKKHEWKKTITR